MHFWDASDIAVFSIWEPFFSSIVNLTRGYAFYAVTARHLIERIRDLGIDECTYVRLNRRDDTAIEVAMDLSDWIFHEDDRVDVAVAALGPSIISDFDHNALPDDMLSE